MVLISFLLDVEKKLPYILISVGSDISNITFFITEISKRPNHIVVEIKDIKTFTT